MNPLSCFNKSLKYFWKYGLNKLLQVSLDSCVQVNYDIIRPYEEFHLRFDVHSQFFWVQGSHFISVERVKLQSNIHGLTLSHYVNGIEGRDHTSRFQNKHIMQLVIVVSYKYWCYLQIHHLFFMFILYV